jgi:LuxR family transcriptional regulator, maltose regulon positive regulatory protein
MLIKTKLQIPPLRQGMVYRPRLIESLLERNRCRLILITGQAGSGKTSLACQWIEGQKIPAIWYSLDESDNEGDLFFRYLLTALGTVDPEMVGQIHPLLYSKKLTIDDILDPFLNWAERLLQDVYIVLDDYHLITSNVVHDAVYKLLQYLPTLLHLVIISRYEPPLPLSALRVRDLVAQVSSVDLRFTEKEVEEFLSRTMALNLTPEQTKELATRAEGWVGGLQLLGLAIRQEGESLDFGRVVGAATRATAQYLVEETIDVQPERVKTFLRTTVFLNRFTADLCKTISGIEEAEEILKYLHAINLFLIPLDAEHEWYRYHHLFSEAVRVRIRTEDSGVASKVHKDAALWFARNNYPEDAFQHAFASGDYEFAGDLMEDYLYLLLERYANASVHRWLSRLPYGIFMERPLLRLDECSLKVLSGDLTEVRATIAHLESQQLDGIYLHDGLKKTRFRNTLAYFKYTLPYHEDPATVDMEAMKKGISEIPRDENLSGATIDATVALCHLFQGDVRSADEVLKESKREVLSAKSIFRRIMWLKVLADVERWSGRLTHSEEILHRALSVIDREHLTDTPLRFFLYLPLAWIYYFHYDLPRAIDYATMSQKYAEQAKYVTEILGANFLLGLLYLAADRKSDADICLQAISMAPNGDSVGSVALAATYTACIHVIGGDLSPVRTWVERRRPSPKDRFSLRLVFECMAYARFLSREGKFAESCKILEAFGKQAVRKGVAHVSIQSEVLRATGLYRMGKRAMAESIIERCLGLAERERYVLPFVESLPFAPALMNEVARSTGSPVLLDALRFADGKAGDASGNSRATQGNNPALTPRETEILKLIAAGYKKGEIANRTFVSPDTIKTHTRHIFEKLDAKTKAEAILRARRSGIIE